VNTPVCGVHLRAFSQSNRCFWSNGRVIRSKWGRAVENVGPSYAVFVLNPPGHRVGNLTVCLIPQTDRLDLRNRASLESTGWRRACQPTTRAVR